MNTDQNDTQQNDLFPFEENKIKTGSISNNFKKSLNVENENNNSIFTENTYNISDNINTNVIVHNSLNDNINDKDTIENENIFFVENKQNDLTLFDNNKIIKLNLNLNYVKSQNLESDYLECRSEEYINSPNLNNEMPSNNDTNIIPKQPDFVEPTNLLTCEQQIKNQESYFYEIEQKNLFYLASLIINNLVKNSSPLTKTLECNENPQINDFFNVNEFILKHGLKNRKGLIFGKKDLWNIFESLVNTNVHASEIVHKVREFTNVKTNLGRVRVFMRLAFVHKVYGEIFQNIVEDVDLLANYYDEGAFMLNNLALDYLFKLTELDDFDFRWCARDENLDEISTLINLTSYWIPLVKDTKNVVYKFSVNKKEFNDLMDEKKFYESKSNEFRNRILFYHNRIEELNLEPLFQTDLVKSSSVVDIVTKKLNEFIKKDQTQDVISLKEDIQTLKKQIEVEITTRLSKEAALESIERDVLIKQDENIKMREEINQLNILNKNLSTKTEEYLKLNKDLDENLVLITGKNVSLMQTLVEIQRNLVSAEAKCNQYLQQNSKLNEEIDEYKKNIEHIQLQYEKEKKENQLLNYKLNENLDEITILKSELQEMKDKFKPCSPLQKKIDALKLRCSEYEQTMEELGYQLQNARLEIENLKEQRIHRDAVWKDDKLVTNCEACNKQFSLNIRKHHCRYCGFIFCNTCSDNKIPLPAGSKPMRVCDKCNYILLERYSAK